MTQDFSYRKDIDGLRAIAVISVVFFHLKIVGFSGGYVGVDIFFVISGYLITKIIYKNIEQNSFSLKTFYYRRIRRIAPALLLMVILVSIVAWLLLKPEDMRSFATSLILQPLSLQNILFLSEGEYFRGAEMKPLLHTWSLAVEEQFYLVWPFILLYFTRFTFRTKLFLIVGLIFISFALNLIFMTLSPKASFFLLPSRAWELGIGGFAVLLETKVIFYDWITKRKMQFALIGSFAIIFSVFGFSADTSFPGYAALLPVIGTVFLLVTKMDTSSYIGLLLTQPIVVHIGLISYPIYLWHWPIIAFMYQSGIDLTQPLYIIAIIILTVVLAEITYRFVELPIRNQKFFSNPKALLIAVTFGFVFLVTFGIHLWYTNGAAYRFSTQARTFLTAPFSAHSNRCGFIFKMLHPNDSVCKLNEVLVAEKRILVWGNSHADMYYELFTDLAKEQNVDLYLNARNCRATPDHDFCGKKVQQKIFDFIVSDKITDVVLASTWHGAYEIPDEIFERHLVEVVQTLSKQKVNIWLVIDVPSSISFDPLSAYEKNPIAPTFGEMPLNEYNSIKYRQVVLFNSISKKFKNVHILDPSLDLCNESVCQSGLGNNPWYRDSSHLTVKGALKTRKQFLPIFLENNVSNL